MSSTNFFIKLFYVYKISKDSSTKYYQNNKKNCKKKLVKDIKVFLKKKKKKSNSRVLSNTKIYQKIKTKQKLVKYRKNNIKGEKAPYYNYKKLFAFRKSTIVL